MQASSSVPQGSQFAPPNRKFGPVLLHFAAIGNIFGNATTFEAIECILYWTADRYSSVTVQNNQLQYYGLREIPYDNPQDVPSLDDDDLFFAAPWPCNVNTTAEEAGEEGNCAYRVSYEANRGLASSLDPCLFGSVGILRGESGNTFLTYDDTFTEMLYGSWQKAWDRHQNLAERETVAGNLKPNDLSSPLASILDAYMRNIAYFTTCAIRATSHDSQQVFGTVHRDVVHYVVNLRYTVYPGALLLLSAVFCIVVAWRTRREKRWKNAQLPLVLQSLKLPESEVAVMMDMSSTEDMARERMVRLVGNRDGLGRMLRVEEGGVPLRRITRQADDERDT
ncbi:hypothetical protein HYQ45_007916 [Verticillium longisporum]|uniref:Uncharacterized protein n=1 Tax=Verticillium longisporum TaxID=100787 RepID=A0A8I3ARE0_VERLO|nr:hypothetical protein HYQ45_007916 [Verticillium longisporum]